MKEMMVGSVGRWGAAPPQALLERMKDYGQEGAFALWDELSPEDRDLLVQDIEVSEPNARRGLGLFGDKISFLAGGGRFGFALGIVGKGFVSGLVFFFFFFLCIYFRVWDYEKDYSLSSWNSAC